MQVYAEASQAVMGEIKSLLHIGGSIDPRGKNTVEFTDRLFCVTHPFSGPIKSEWVEHNRVMAAYFAEEVRLYDAGELNAAVYAERAKLWNAVKNPDGTVNSCYGHLIAHALRCRTCWDGVNDLTQWQWARRRLEADKASRQAIVRVGGDKHQWEGVRDLPCTMHLNFLVRCGRLNLTAVMRSCDVTRGLPYDMPYFILLQERMLGELQATYPDLKMGTYTHFAHSLHLYETEVAKARKMIGDT